MNISYMKFIQFVIWIDKEQCNTMDVKMKIWDFPKTEEEAIIFYNCLYNYIIIS